jgi:glucokinase
VVGPGTGLGVAALIRTRDGWHAVPGEGGHATLAPHNELESEILARVREVHGHVSAERLLSGIGLPLLHKTMLQIKGLAVRECPTPLLLAAGLEGDTQARETLHVFCAMLGGFAGNVALSLGARGGLFIGGGIVPKLGDFFFASEFRERFEAKGRFADYLSKIPTALILDTDAALYGALNGIEHRL